MSLVKAKVVQVTVVTVITEVMLTPQLEYLLTFLDSSNCHVFVEGLLKQKCGKIQILGGRKGKERKGE